MKVKLTFDNGINEMITPKGSRADVIAFLYLMITKIEDNARIGVIDSEDTFSETTWQNVKSIEIEIDENDKMTSLLR
ncbi:hypothetical protein [Shouchella miscanthi]|uniref:hypothetical protein n=1 Tax=Shouchella miscanthi TaxID=2598861 RepID=UPI0011A8650E|nr:hypothetical protein [Shouchella miscanthi]